jgi:hypothetical protein
MCAFSFFLSDSLMRCFDFTPPSSHHISCPLRHLQQEVFVEHMHAGVARPKRRSHVRACLRLLCCFAGTWPSPRLHSSLHKRKVGELFHASLSIHYRMENFHCKASRTRNSAPHARANQIEKEAWSIRRTRKYLGPKSPLVPTCSDIFRAV